MWKCVLLAVSLSVLSSCTFQHGVKTSEQPSEPVPVVIIVDEGELPPENTDEVTVGLLANEQQCLEQPELTLCIAECERWDNNRDWCDVE